MFLWFVSLTLLLASVLVWAQPPAATPQEQLAQCLWTERQLRASRDQAEKNVAVLGAQLEKLQAEFEQARKNQLPEATE